MALVEGCADFEGDESWGYTMRVVNIGTGEELIETVTETFGPLGTSPRERIVYVFDVGEPEPEPTGIVSILYALAEEMEDHAVDLRAIADALLEAQEGAANLHKILSGM